MRFFLIQFIGFAAWIFLILSYWKKDTNEIIFFQVISKVLYVIHYTFLFALSAVVVLVTEFFIDILYLKREDDDKIFKFFLPVYALIGIFTFNGAISLFPIFASVADEYTLTRTKGFIVIGAIIADMCWVVYNIKVGSYIGIITESILIITNTINFIKTRKLLHD